MPPPPAPPTPPPQAPPAPQPARKSILDQLGQAKQIYEIVTWLGNVMVGVVGLIRSNGGVVQFLVEVGAFGFACYMAMFTVARVVMHFAEEYKLSEDTSGILFGVSVLGGGALIRFGLFAPGFTEGLDTIGTAFLALVGLGCIILSIVILRELHRGKPKT